LLRARVRHGNIRPSHQQFDQGAPRSYRATLRVTFMDSRINTQDRGFHSDFPASRVKWIFCSGADEVVQLKAWTQHVIAPTRYHEGHQPAFLDLIITNERYFIDQVIINAPLEHSDHCVLTFDFICYWARNPEPRTWIPNFCRADFSGMCIFLEQIKLGLVSVVNVYRTIVQKVHEVDAMFVPKSPHAVGSAACHPKRSGTLWKRGLNYFSKS
ncbi:hypothetical protein CLF_113309, partial [Clonorchis sinensis]